MSERYDLIIVGAGSAGLTAAAFGARFGAKVALVEKERIGGDCTWTGCVPSKALLQVAKVAQAARTASQYGIRCGQPQVDMGQVQAYLQRVMAEVHEHETPAVLQEMGIEVVSAEARFLDPHTIEAGQRSLTATRFVVATGARPIMPTIEGIEDVPHLTYRQIFDNDTLPSRLLVLGAGPVGAEIAQAYGRLGAQVTIIDVGLLPQEEPEVAQVLGRVFAREGITLVEGVATAVRQRENELFLRVGDEEVPGDMLLVAVGRRPVVNGLDLENAGVDYGREGIWVDDYLRTSANHIYAAGDCVGSYQFTHFAGWQAFRAVRNALLPGKERGFKDAVPRTIFTDPEVAHVGLTEAAAREKHGDGVRVSYRPLTQIDRAVTDNARDGFIKVLHREDGSLLGATIVAPRAGDMVAEFVLGMEEGMRVNDLAGIIHTYPTYATGVQQLAADVATADFLDSITGKIALKLAGLGG